MWQIIIPAVLVPMAGGFFYLGLQLGTIKTKLSAVENKIDTHLNNHKTKEVTDRIKLIKKG